MARRDTNSRFTPDTVQNYQITPSASAVDKQLKYTPQLEDSAQLKATAQGLSKLAKGITDVNYVLEKQANDNAIEAYAKTEEKNKADWAEVSRNIDGMAKFNPYNQEAYKKIRAKANMEQGLVELARLEARANDLTYEAFETEKQAIQDKIVNNMAAEGLKPKHTADYLTKFHDTSEILRRNFVEKKEEQKYQITQNAMVTNTARNFATYDNNLEGWNNAVGELTNMANGLGMDDTKQYELLTKSINQYLIDNIDDIDAEEFILKVGQTKINGKSLSEFDPSYTDNMKQLLVKAKRTKLESDSIDLEIKNTKNKSALLRANVKLLEFMTTGKRTDTEILNKAYELIESEGLEEVGFSFLHSVVGNKQTLLALQTTTTDPDTHNDLITKYITGDLSQDDIENALKNKKLSASDAYTLFNQMESKSKEDFKEQIDAINHLYINPKSVYDIGEEKKAEMATGTYEIISDTTLTNQEKARELERIKKIGEDIVADQENNKSKDPLKLLTASYMKTQKFKDHNKGEAQRALVRMRMFKNGVGWNDSNIQVTSAMQANRTVTLSDGTVKEQAHTGTDIATWNGRQIYAPYNVTVLASGHTPSTGNYLLLSVDGGKGYIKMMHLQQANLPKAGTKIGAGQKLAHVGNTGHVTNKDTGVLHIEFFDKAMRIQNPAQFKRWN
jgi:murein DD-endopeptidase MepM/ murein hydrolase activator NlpD